MIVRTLIMSLIFRQHYSLLNPGHFKCRNKLQQTKLLSLINSISSKESPQPQYIFVGGKGGVGKTSTSAALALALSDKSFRTLVVSTDPAHSLGDSLDLDLSSGIVERVPTELNLWALEVDADAAMQDFRALAKDFNAAGIAGSLGVPTSLLESIGLDDITSIFTNPPPGIDEIVALTNVFQRGEETLASGERRFQRVVIDTAPTGHTLRLLQLPAFLGTVTGKLLSLRAALSRATESLRSAFQGESDRAQTSPLDRLEGLQRRLQQLQSALKDPARTQFVAVTIPTSLALDETRRLLAALRREQVRVTGLVCNQIVADNMGATYLAARARSQRVVLDSLYAQLANSVEVTEVPFVDTEVTGLYGLHFFGSLAHPVGGASNPIGSKRLTIFGGKGGVGKTTSASSWALRLAEAGFRTLVVSTDPAHSLGDALALPLTGVPLQLDTGALCTAEGGELWALEIDPQAALDEFRDIVAGSTGNAVGSTGGAQEGFLGALGLPDLRAGLADLLAGARDPPPGTDEVVALARVVSYLEHGLVLPDGRTLRFDRVVLDTAPTGHTLRMLQLPPFLLQLTRKLRAVRDRASAGGVLGAMFGSSIGGSRSGEGVEESDRLQRFERSMESLEALLRDPALCEFTVVTIPTALASAESLRLLLALRAEEIFVRRLLVNQLMALPRSDEDEQEQAKAAAAEEAFLNRLRQGQGRILREVRQLSVSENLPLTEIPYFDTEVRTVYGLRVISRFLFPE